MGVHTGGGGRARARAGGDARGGWRQLTRPPSLPSPLPSTPQTLVELEQVLVTGCDADGGTVGSKTLEARMKAAMQNPGLS